MPLRSGISSSLKSGEAVMVQSSFASLDRFLYGDIFNSESCMVKTICFNCYVHA